MSVDPSANPIARRSDEEIRRLLWDLILELAPNRDEVLVENPRLIDDLGYHSLALLELAFTIEDEFGLDPIEEETAQQIVTFLDVVDYVIEQLRSLIGT